ncbi:MAG: hypothetical protein EKK51_30520 [Mycolicibacterium sp.]|uniref:hypothetical protein n=1 Tax=Mycobacteriaceae TaxID=1762 RepID=UPI000FA13650|nr:hypothetical protein [Mycolicibacterium sp.]RUP26281.1 MAG: hypothetical protein EKK51_30520 [Mycolicibacterium sp.]
MSVITAVPISSDDPRVYTDPYPTAIGSDVVREDCWKCGGDGLFHGVSGWKIKNPRGAGAIKGCFACMGAGYRLVKVSTVRARVRRNVKATLRHDQEVANHAANAARYAAEEYAAAWDEAHAEQACRDALNNTPAGAVGDKLRDLTGRVEVAISFEVDGFRGYGTDYKRLVVLKLPTGQVLKTTGTGSSLFGVDRGDQVTIVSATVSGTGDYKGQLQTVLTRAKLRVDVPAHAAGDAPAEARPA